MSSFPPPEFSVVRPPQTLDVFLLGLVEFSAAQTLLRHFAGEIAQTGQHRATLLLCEHPPCSSRGTATVAEPVAAEPDATAAAVTEECHVVSRAGGRIEHGPGQIAVYPVFSLAHLEISPLGFLTDLEQILVRLCQQAGVPGAEVEAGLGIQARTGLVARTALQVKHEISQYGAYLNVSQNYSLTGTLRSSSMETAALKKIEPASLKSQLVQQFEHWLNHPKVNIYTRHPLLGRKKFP